MIVMRVDTHVADRSLIHAMLESRSVGCVDDIPPEDPAEDARDCVR